MFIKILTENELKVKIFNYIIRHIVQTRGCLMSHLYFFKLYVIIALGEKSLLTCLLTYLLHAAQSYLRS